MIDHGSRSTGGPGPSGSGFRAQKYDPPPLKQTIPTTFVLWNLGSRVGVGGLGLTKLTTGKEYYTFCLIKFAWKKLTMAPEAHGAQVLPDLDFGPKNMIRPH